MPFHEGKVRKNEKHPKSPNEVLLTVIFVCLCLLIYEEYFHNVFVLVRARKKSQKNRFVYSIQYD